MSIIDEEISSMDWPPGRKRQRIGEEVQEVIYADSWRNDENHLNHPSGESSAVHNSTVEETLEQGSLTLTPVKPEPSRSGRDTNSTTNTPQARSTASFVLNNASLSSLASSTILTKTAKKLDVDPGKWIKHDLSQSPEVEVVEISLRKDKGKAKEKISPSPPPSDSSQPYSQAQERQEEQTESLSEYTCPICFFPPSNATLTPCGHVCCGSCLFTAVKTTLKRGANMGMAIGTGENVARCPVCRAIIHGWDGKGGGVIGLKIRQVINL